MKSRLAIARNRVLLIPFEIHAHLAHPWPELPSFVHQGLRAEQPIQPFNLDPERSYRV
jgi:hypothetical protein